MGLLSGLDGMGLGGLDAMKLYEDPAQNEKKTKKTVSEGGTNAPEVKEQDYIFEKSYTCHACDREFKSLTVKANKAKLLGTDRDLRPTYENIEPLKYDVIMCPYCGCAAVGRYWTGLTDNQRRLIKNEISANYRPKDFMSDTYSFDEAIERYQLALANAMVKQSKPSEKAYICLRAGWTLRSKAESLDPRDDDYEKVNKETKEMEREFLRSALDGFVSARSTETFPICGMDENTMDYLIAALSVEFEQYDQAARLIGNVLTSRTISPRMREKALELKEIIINSRR